MDLTLTPPAHPHTIFPPAVEVALAVGSVLNSDQTSAAVTYPLSTAAMRLAHTLRLSGLLYALNLSQDLHTEEAWWKQSTMHLLRIEALMTAWPQDAPPPLLIKGAAYEFNLYTSPGARGASDWDLLIPEPWFSKIADQWSQKWGAPDLPRTARQPHEIPYSLGFHVNGMLLELHRDPAPQFQSFKEYGTILP